MIIEFLDFIKENNLLNKDDKILLSLSGGRDSVALFKLFLEVEINFECCHCNYNLRGEDSIEDMKFVEELCKQNNIKLYIANFDTNAYAEEEKLSIEIAARNLRYNWYEELCIEHNFTKIATAHHLNDQAETFFINLMRSTGLNGICGIPVIRPLNKESTNNYIKNCHIIRPLLFASRNQIDDFLKRTKYQDDYTNFTDKYLRNKVRLNVIPEIEKITPNFISQLQKSINNFKNTNSFVSRVINDFFPIIVLENGIIKLNIPSSYNKQELEGFLYLALYDYNFNLAQISDITSSYINNSIGKLFYSKNFCLVIDRGCVLIEKINIDNSFSIPIPYQNLNEDCNFFKDKTIIPQNSFHKEILKNFFFSVLNINEISTYITPNNISYLDMDKIAFPIKITNWEYGDYFYPLGMKNKKKVSDFLIDEKINMLEKDKLQIVKDNNNNILWIVNYRIDDRYKITNKTKKILKITFSGC
ncbi:MAG: tRNA lysidine(34) synthetase TilS [Bacteroidales bacterium]